MAHLTDYKLQRILTRFPWRRRKPRGQSGSSPIGLTTREGQQLWADPEELARFDDPGPALVCVAMHGDATGQLLIVRLVAHQAESRGTPLPSEGPEMTRAGLEILESLIEDSGLDPDEALGPHTIGELLRATWAVAAASVPAAS